MARHAAVLARRFACLGIALAAFAGTRALPSRAQSLLTLHVRSFTMSAEPASLRVGETFRLTIAAHVDEQILELDNVTLPDLSGFNVLGDERRCSATARGSDCVETLSVSPIVEGNRTIAATIMDAIDGRNGKRSRFSTNTIALRVAGAPPHLPGWIAEIVWSIALAALPLLAAAFVLYVILRQFGRRRPIARPESVAPPEPQPVVDRDARLRALVASLRDEPSRDRVLAVREALRERVGAREDETLADIVRRYRNGSHPHVLAALVAIERPSFCEEHNVARAVEEALPSLNF